MKINPLLKKDVISCMRSGRTVAAAVLLQICLSIMVLLSIYEESQMNPFDQIFDYQDLNRLIVMTGAMILGFTLLYLPFIAAKTIVIERQKQNLDLILLASGSSARVVLGKLLSVLFVYFIILFSTLPILSVVWSIGGGSMWMLFQMMLLFLFTALSAASISIFFSTLTKRKTTAVVCAYITIIVLCFLTLFVFHICGIDSWEHLMRYHTARPKSLFLGNPIVAFLYFISQEHADSAHLYQGIYCYRDFTFQSILVQIILSMILLTASAYIIKPFQVSFRKKQ